MSRESGQQARGNRHDVSGGLPTTRPFLPQFYPGVVGYQGAPYTWFPSHPSTGVPGQWNPSWLPLTGYPPSTQPWPTPQAPSTTTTSSPPSSEYTVDALRRIYRDSDKRVEIQRVKVQRRQPETGPEAMSVVPAGSIQINERRPPPRKKHRNPQMHMPSMVPPGPYPWYPYMPYPYPYPPYFPGCMWPPGAPSPSASPWGTNEGTDAGNSQRLESRTSHDALTSPMLRSSSPAAPSHITDSHSLGPSDSVSVRSRKRETSLERALRGPTPPPRTKSRASSSIGCKSDTGRTQDWMFEMQRALQSRDVDVSGDKGIGNTDPFEVYRKIPPIRKKRKARIEDMSDKSSAVDLRDDLSERQSLLSDGMFNESTLGSDLNYAFTKLERSVNAFKTEIAGDASPIQSHPASPSVDLPHSSGDTTPTEGNITPTLFSDIQALAGDGSTLRRGEYKHPRDISESISSLPSLEVARITASDVSLHTKASVEQSQGTRDTSTATPTPCPSSPPPTFITQAAASLTETKPLQTSHQVKPQTETSPTSVEPRNTNTTQSEQEPDEARQHDQVSVIQKTQTGITNEPGTATSTGPTSPDRGVEGGGRQSRSSNATTFFSAVTTDDSNTLDLDSTDIPLPATDSTTADENEESQESPTPKEEDQLWVLQQPKEAPTLDTEGQDDRLSAWRAEVSLWRARLVVSLCRGGGLDHQDWPILHLLVHHPLTLDLKLSLLHAPRLCAANSAVGPAVMRLSLLQLAQQGKLLLQPEEERQAGWHCIRLDSGQAWTAIKGGVEILHSLGYKEIRSGVELRHRRRSGPEASVVARLTLDMLVLAEEFRLFLTRAHQYPNNVSSLFFSDSTPSATQDRPPSSTGSFVSALSEAVKKPRDAGVNVNSKSRMRSTSESLTAMEDRDVTGLKKTESQGHTEILGTCITETNVNSKSRIRSTSESVTVIEDRDAIGLKNTTSEVNTETNVDSKSRIRSSENLTVTEDRDVTGLNITASQANTETNVNAKSRTRSTSESLAVEEKERSGMNISASQPALDTKTGTHKTNTNSQLNTQVSQTLNNLNKQSSSMGGGLQHTRESETQIAKETKENKSRSATPRTTEVNRSSPEEEHVYEEIDVVRGQVQSIRGSSVPAESTPPPLPPKKKVTLGQDESGLSLTGPNTDWSSASMPGSLRGKSTGARRKKRRAPMPPEFLNVDWKGERVEGRHRSTEDIRSSVPNLTRRSESPRKEYNRTLNPFYEDIDELQDGAKDAGRKSTDEGRKTKSTNPFYEESHRASGYIGKNPFYDDVEVLKNSEEFKNLQESRETIGNSTSEISPTANTGEGTEPPVVRPKRRAPKPPPTPEPKDKDTETKTDDSKAQEECMKEGAVKVITANVPLVENGTGNTDQQNTGNTDTVMRNGNSDHIAKSTGNTDQASTQEMVTSNGNTDQTDSSNCNTETGKQDGSINIGNTGETGTRDMEQSNGNTDLTDKQEENNNKTNNELEIKTKHETELRKNKHTIANNTVAAGKTNTPKPATEHSENMPENSEHLKHIHRTPILHPKTPPPLPPSLAKLQSAPELSDVPPALPPKAPLCLLDEIPYMDASELRNSRIVDETPADETPTASPTGTLRLNKLNKTEPQSLNNNNNNTTSLCPPPLPPSSPPHSRPETPHRSPPSTPHTSPPETPHNSPPESPHASPPSTPHTSPPLTPQTSPPITPRMSKKRSPLRPRRTQDHTKTEECPKTPPDDPPPVPPKNFALEAEIENERRPSKPSSPSLPPKTKPKGTPPPPPRPEKPSLAHIPVTATPSGQSSASEERYEIPDTSRAPPPTPVATNKKQVNGKKAPPSEYDRYEVPEAPKDTKSGVARKDAQAAKGKEPEERYEIPRAVKDQPVKKKVNGTTLISAKHSCIIL